MATNCEFELKRRATVFYNNEQIEGLVHLSTAKRSAAAELITLTFGGWTRVQWIEPSTASAQIVHNDCSSAEHPLLTGYRCSGHQQHVWDSKQLATNVQLLQRVCHTYSFCFRVPEKVPVTCRLPHGETEYKLRLLLRLQCGARTKNKVFEHRVVIRNRVDLRRETQLSEPRSVGQETGAACLRLSLPRTGFVPGQQIPFRLTGHSPNPVLVQLKQHVSYRCSQPHHRTKETVQTVAHRMCQSSDEFSSLSLPLWCTMSSLDEDSSERALSVSYSLEAVLVAAGVGQQVLERVSVPIRVGTMAFPAQLGPDVTDYLCYENRAITLDEAENSPPRVTPRAGGGNTGSLATICCRQSP